MTVSLLLTTVYSAQRRMFRRPAFPVFGLEARRLRGGLEKSTDLFADHTFVEPRFWSTS
jgi:hypothetical protein